MSEKKDDKSFWTTLPGILTGFAAVLTAVGGLITALYAAGVCQILVSIVTGVTPTTTLIRPTATGIPPTSTLIRPTATGIPPTNAVAPPTAPTEITCTPTYSLSGTSPGTGEILLANGDLSAKGADVYLNDKCQGKMFQQGSNALFLIAQVPPGTYTIKVARSGYKDFTITTIVKSGQRSEVSFDLAPK